jgi:putative ABC transport system permease protein
MNVVEVKEQFRLPLAKCVELVLSGIRYRLFRAGITVVIISLAVAFLMTMLSEGLIARNVAGSVSLQTGPRRMLLFWVNRVSIPLTSQVLADELAAANPGGDRAREFAAWGKLDDAAVTSLIELARSGQQCQKYFESLSPGSRSRLVGASKGVEMFTYLAAADNFRHFEENYRTGDTKLRVSIEEFKAFLDKWTASEPHRAAIMAGHKAAVEQVRAGPLASGKTPAEMLAGADDALVETLGKYGYILTADEMATVREQAALTADANWIASLLKVTMLKNRLAERRSMNAANVDPAVLYDEVSSASGGQWLLKQLSGKDVQAAAAKASVSIGRPLDADRMAVVAADWQRAQRTAQVEQAVSMAVSDGFMGFSPRTLWLIVVSFMVCVVGIANAMLMSVTERFREIATMKCLGATDGFIMINFILESMMQGIAGGIIGAILGLILGVLRSWANYGFMTFTQFPGLEVAAIAAGSLVTGVLISALAAVYPAWVAARLAPMEAMRIE